MTWVLTVVSPTISWVAISLLVMPLASSWKTSSSRGVSLVEPGCGADGCSGGGEFFDQAAGDAGCEQRVAVTDGAYACGELVRGDVFEQESARAGAQGVVDVFVEVEGGQDQHARSWARGFGRGSGG